MFCLTPKLVQITHRTKCETKFYIFYVVMQPHFLKISNKNRNMRLFKDFLV